MGSDKDTVTVEALGQLTQLVGGRLIGHGHGVLGAGVVRANVWAPLLLYGKNQLELWSQPSELDNWERAEITAMDTAIYAGIGIVGIYSRFAPGAAPVLAIAADVQRDAIHAKFRDYAQWDWLTNLMARGLQ